MWVAPEEGPRPDQAEAVEAARVRLTASSAEGGMGELFRVAAAIAPQWPQPEGVR